MSFALPQTTFVKPGPHTCPCTRKLTASNKPIKQRCRTPILPLGPRSSCRRDGSTPVSQQMLGTCTMSGRLALQC